MILVVPSKSGYSVILDTDFKFYKILAYTDFMDYVSFSVGNFTVKMETRNVKLHFYMTGADEGAIKTREKHFSKIP